MNEEEARTKVCRIGQIAQMVCAGVISNAYDMSNFTQTGLDKLGICIASECMLWVWVVSPERAAKNRARAEGGRCIEESGHCGLAGRP